MKITGGKDRSRLIKTPKLEGLRPTLDKIRKAIFDILQDRIVDKVVLDLFSGSGAIGLEAISRGAKRIYFVEREKACIDAINENIELLNYEDRANVLWRDVFKAIKEFGEIQKKFDIIIMDPPYKRNLAKKALLKISTYDIIKTSGLVIAEHTNAEKLPGRIDLLKLFRQVSYGERVLSFYKLG